jgi:hypothetical protein
MKVFIRKLILKCIPKKIADFIFYHHPLYLNSINSSNSFSQEGEDMVLKRVFNNRSTGVYVDIGAHHPSVFSNTNYFYQLGWRGINIDGLPGSKIDFNKNRPRDINLELLIAETEEDIEFYLFEPSLMNTISKKQAESNTKFDWCVPKGSTMVHAMPLSKVFDQYLEPGIKIDFMSVDVEGAEMSVLKSNNWDKYKPDVLLIEYIDLSIEDILKSEIHTFLTDLFYNFFAKTGNTVFYKQRGFFEF